MLTAHPLRAAAAALLTAGLLTADATDADVTATVIERAGTRHEVENLAVRGSTKLEYYVDGRRRLLDLTRIERIRVGGTAQDQQVPVTVTLRTGRVEKGEMIVDGGSSPSEDLAGGSYAGDHLTGRTSLGPLLLPLTDVQEILLEHDADEPLIPDAVNGSIIDDRGRRFIVSDIRYRGDESFRYQQGRKKRRVALRHVSRLEFGDAIGGEIKPVTITYKTGRIIQGEVDASTVRLPGEVDHVYFTRVDSAFTGQRPGGSLFGIGLQDVELILFDDPDEEDDEEDDDEGAAGAEPATR
jgi:hypothetical protein